MVPHQTQRRRGRYEHESDYAVLLHIFEPKIWRSNLAVAPTDVFPACPGDADSTYIAGRLRPGDTWGAQRDEQPHASDTDPESYAPWWHGAQRLCHPEVPR